MTKIYIENIKKLNNDFFRIQFFGCGVFYNNQIGTFSLRSSIGTLDQCLPSDLITRVSIPEQGLILLF